MIVAVFGLVVGEGVFGIATLHVGRGRDGEVDFREVVGGELACVAVNEMVFEREVVADVGGAVRVVFDAEGDALHLFGNVKGCAEASKRVEDGVARLRKFGQKVADKFARESNIAASPTWRQAKVVTVFKLKPAFSHFFSIA